MSAEEEHIFTKRHVSIGEPSSGSPRPVTTADIQTSRPPLHAKARLTWHLSHWRIGIHSSAILLSWGFIVVRVIEVVVDALPREREIRLGGKKRISTSGRTSYYLYQCVETASYVGCALIASCFEYRGTRSRAGSTIG